MCSDDRVRVAIAGCGSFGTGLAGSLSGPIEGFEVTALCSRRESSRRRALSKLPQPVPTFASLDQLLTEAADRIDAVMVTGANYEHRDQVIAAARAGKHIFCEKAMALTSEDCRQMVEAALENEVCLMVGHKRRLRVAWRRLTEIAHGGEIGRPVAININGWSNNPRITGWWLRWDQGGGLLHGAGVHDIDYMHAVMGESAWVSAVASPPARPEADFPETMWVTIGFQSGAVGGLQSSLNFSPTAYADSFHVQIIGTGGSALLRRARYQVDLCWGSAGGELSRESLHDDAREAFRTELTSFADWVRRGTKPVLSWREGWRCVQVMEAAYRSAENGGSRITLEDLPQ